MLHFGLEGYIRLALYVAGIVVFFLCVFWRPEIGIHFTLPKLAEYRNSTLGDESNLTYLLPAPEGTASTSAPKG